MKVRSLKQALHWLFLVVGILCLVLLVVSTRTYLGFASEGYGLSADLESVHLSPDDDPYWVGFTFGLKNPGKLDIDLQTATLTIGGDEFRLPTNTPYPQTPQGQYPVETIPNGETISVVLWFNVGKTIHDNIAMNGQVNVHIDMELFVPKRYCTTGLIFEDTAVIA
ncbi:MAG: hypothetical protein AYK23_02605 [Candidatus Proteinoplasmatales archaeon SG8-5]|nr:MAG: hypothetical protein AYK23_02605 [Candidatus Proteinoplasmatales archaeon SG8-5]